MTENPVGAISNRAYGIDAEKPRLPLILRKHRRYLRKSLLIYELRQCASIADLGHFPLMMDAANALKFIDAAVLVMEEPHPLYFRRNLVPEMKNSALKVARPGLHLRMNRSHREHERKNIFERHVGTRLNLNAFLSRISVGAL